MATIYFWDKENKWLVIKKVSVTEEDLVLEELLELSEEWAEERIFYRFLENDVRDYVDVIGVIATSYQYNRLLKFYIEELDFQFNHALLVKRAHE